MSGPTGSQPHLKLLATSGMEVNVPSTMVPCSSSTREARSMAMAPPSEWPKM
jgi:predicted aconitase